MSTILTVGTAGAGAAITASGGADPGHPDWRAPDVAALDAQRARCRDVYEGTDRLHEVGDGETYLPKFPRETQTGYDLRLADSVLTNLFGSAIDAGVGLVCKRPPALAEDTHARVVAWADDVDSAGSSLATYFRGTVKHMLLDGVCGVLVEYPKLDARPRLTEQRDRRLAPYLVRYTYDQVYSYELAETNAGRIELVQLVLSETVRERVSRFGYRVVAQFRHLYRDEESGAVHFEVWRRGTETGVSGADWELADSGTYRGVTSIPFIEFAADASAGFFQSKPPMLDVCDLNLAHYRMNSNRRWALTSVCFPWPVRIGYEPPPEEDQKDVEKTVSPTTIIDLPAGGDFKFEAPPGTAFGPTKDELDTLVQNIASMALAHLSGKATQPETAEAARLDSDAQDATLAAIGANAADALNEVIYFVGQYEGIPIERGAATATVDLRAAHLDPALLAVLSTMNEKGQLPLDILLYALKHGRLPDDFDVQDETMKALADQAAKRDAELDAASELQARRQAGAARPPAGRQA